nr:MAG TPA: hypothetical protein [Caudoviricetes sp.]
MATLAGGFFSVRVLPGFPCLFLAGHGNKR